MYIVYKIIMCLGFSGIVTELRYLFIIGLVTDKKRNKLINYATSKNQILKGKLIKLKNIRRPVTLQKDDLRDNYYYKGTYEYQYNNQTYRTTIIDAKPLRGEIDLFYVKNPRKATSEYNLGKNETNSLCCFIISFIVFILFAFLVFNK